MPNAQLGFCLVTIATSTIVGFAALQSTRSRWPWWLRLLCLAAMLGLLFWVRAYEPIVFFMLQLAVTLTGAGWFAKRTEVSTAAHFSLKHLLIFVGFSAFLMSVIVRCSVPTAAIWINLCGGGIAAGVATLVAAWPAFVDTHRWRRYFIAAALLALATIPMTVTDCFLTMYPYGWRWSATLAAQTGEPFPYLANFCTWYGVLLTISSLVFLLLWTAKCLRIAPSKQRPTLRIGFSTLLGVLVGYCLIVYVRMPSYPPPLVEVEPANPNGYAAFESVATQENQNEQDMVDRIAESLKVPWSFPARTDGKTVGDHWTRTRPLFELLDDRARAMAEAGDIDETISRCETQLSISGKYMNDSPTVMGRYLAGSYGQSAMGHLSNVRRQMNTMQIDRVLPLLLRNEREQVSVDELIRSDQALSIRAGGWPTVLFFAIASRKDQQFADSASRDWNGVRATRRLLIVDLLIRKHQQAHNKLPRRLEDVVSAESKALEVWIDPCSELSDPLRYDPKGETFLLYSLNVDGKDNGGTAPNKRLSKSGDLLLDVRFGP